MTRFRQLLTVLLHPIALRSLLMLAALIALSVGFGMERRSLSLIVPGSIVLAGLVLSRGGPPRA